MYTRKIEHNWFLIKNDYSVWHLSMVGVKNVRKSIENSQKNGQKSTFNERNNFGLTSNKNVHLGTIF